MRLVFFGTPGLAVHYLIELTQDPRQVIAGIVTQPDKPKGRGLTIWPCAVKEAAGKLNIPVLLQPENLKNADFVRAFKNTRCDLGVVVAFGRIIPKEILSLPRHGLINVHFSLLPQLRGPSPVETSILWGLEKTGVTIFWITEKMDAGPIISQEALPINPQETAPQLRLRLIPLGMRLLKEALEKIPLGRAPRQTQEEAQASYSKIIKKEDGFVSWESPASEIERKIRAFVEWPKAQAQLFGKNVAILEASVHQDTATDKKTGEIIGIEKARGFVIKCKEGSLLIERVHPEGKKPMLALDFLRGIRRIS